MTTLVRLTHRITIETHYLGPTNYRGSRIVARTVNGQRLTVSYDYALNGDENHAAAASALADTMIPRHWAPVTLIGGATIAGYAFVMLEPEDDPAIESRTLLANGDVIETRLVNGQRIGRTITAARS